MKLSSLLLIFCFHLIFIQVFSQSSTQSIPIALVGGTVIDVRNFGNSTADLKNTVVIVLGDKILEVGEVGKIKIPANAKVIDVSGKYIIPGLTDGFASMNCQAHANAYLYLGVTGIVSKCEVTSPNCIGNWYAEAIPAPRLYPMGGITWRVRNKDSSFTIQSEEEILKSIEAAVKRGARRIFSFHPQPPQVMKFIVPNAKRLGLGTIAEISVSSYSDALEAGVQSFLHTNRYSRDLAPPEMQAEFVRLEDAPKEFIPYIASLDPKGEKVQRWAKRLSESKVALMPTLSLFYNFLPVHDNPWKEPIAAIIDPSTIVLPLNRETGNQDNQQASQEYIENIFRIETEYRKAGARYLVGSGTFAFGTMPGISTHTEMKLLVKIGLTPRQVIAAATNNYAEVYGWKDMGLIESGRVADLLVLNENPLQNIENLKKIHTVMLKGEILERDKLLRK